MNILSNAQNNSVRKILKLLEPLLNKIIDTKLSANEVSFLGLQKSISGINKIYNSKNILEKFYGFYLFIFGTFIDLLDGIRARSIYNPTELSGQLVDGFCDRTKEFYFFYKKYSVITIKSKTTRQSQQLLTALSCILPSIARAINELLNQVVSEKDKKGGSMLDRIFLIFKSIFFYIIGLDKKAIEIDQIIYERNVATFNNRVTKINFNKLRNLKEKKLNEFQKKALIRLAFYLKIYNEELLICKLTNKYKIIQSLRSLLILKNVSLKKEEKLIKMFRKLFTN